MRTKLRKYHFEMDPAWFVSKFKSGNFEDEINMNKGFLQLSNFLPDEIARRIYDTLRALKDDEWEMSKQEDNKYQDNTAHSFLSAAQFPNSQFIFRIFQQLLPGKRSSFAAAQYTNTHHIDEHDDKSHQQIQNDVYSRAIALVYYLTPNWQSENGGLLVDLESDTKYVPQFNSLIAFNVPRRHLVTAVTTNESRFSIFGWYLSPGILYPLSKHQDSEDGSEADGDESNFHG